MIKLIKIEKSYSNGFGTKVLAFVDDIYVGQVQKVHVETEEYLQFMNKYSKMSKQERLDSDTPTRWKLNYYEAYPSHESISSERCYSLEQLELFFRNQLSVDSVSKLQEFLGNKVVPI